MKGQGAARRLRAWGAFTLVELLVVIAIVGVLAGLLLPAVQSARESSRGVQCRNNNMQLQRAFAARETAIKAFPGYLNNVGDKDTDNQVRASWVVMLLPYIEQQALWDQWAPGHVSFHNGKLDEQYRPPLEGFVCPSDPQVRPREPNLSYVVNAGDIRRTDGGCDLGFYPYPGTPHKFWGENLANGMLVDKSRHREGPNDQTGPAPNGQRCCAKRSIPYKYPGDMTM